MKYQSVQQWEREKRGTAPSRKKQPRVAEVLGVTVAELMTGQKPTVVQDRAEKLGPREELLVELFRGLTPEQQMEAMKELRAMYQANRKIQEFLPSRLRTVSNEDVERAFGKVPAPQRPKPKKQARPKRDPGAAMDDFLEE